MTQKYNICLIQPENYVHAGAFLEIADLLKYALHALGHESEIQKNNIDPSARNIIIGVHLLNAEAADQIPADTIILNTEQLGGVYGDWNENILKWFSKPFTLWDYSDTNVQYLREFGVEKVEKLSLGYQPELCRIKPQPEKTVDVLFYGCINERRRQVLAEMEARGLRVKVLNGIYGAARDAWIERSRLVLNLHFFDTQIFEIVRVFYLMTNAIPSLVEVNPTTRIEPFFENALPSAPYAGLVQRVEDMLNAPDDLPELGRKAQKAIMEMPQTELLRPLVR